MIYRDAVKPSVTHREGITLSVRVEWDGQAQIYEFKARSCGAGAVFATTVAIVSSLTVAIETRAVCDTKVPGVASGTVRHRHLDTPLCVAVTDVFVARACRCGTNHRRAHAGLKIGHAEIVFGARIEVVTRNVCGIGPRPRIDRNGSVTELTRVVGSNSTVGVTFTLDETVAGLKNVPAGTGGF